MPMESKAQNRAMHAAASDPAVAKRIGIPQKVANRFVEASHGQRVRDLPERAQAKAQGGRLSPRSVYPEEGGVESYQDWNGALQGRVRGGRMEPGDSAAVAATPDPGDQQMERPTHGHPGDRRQRGQAPLAEPQAMAAGGTFTRKAFKW